MKILLCNKFYYRRGGDCIFAMNLEKLLKEKGHEVAFYAMQYPENEPSVWSKYWPKNMSKVDAFTRPFGAKQVVDGFNQLLDDFFGPVDPNWGEKTKTIKTPEGIVSHEASEIVSKLPSSASSSSTDSLAASSMPSGKKQEKQPFGQYDDCVVHLNNIHTHLSPVIAEIAHERGIRVVWTLHDSKLSCPCYTCQRDGKWCEECFTDKTAVIKHRCMPGSVPGAIIGYCEMKMWNKDRLQKCVDLFLPPSQFMMDIAVKSGYDAEKFRVNCNFIDVEKVTGSRFEKEDYYTFLGRVTSVKGIRTLCEAAGQLPYKLKVIGGGDLLDELKTKYTNIEFLGEMNWDQLKPVMQKSKFMVLPSEWSENNPLTVIEAQSLGTPVLGAKIGGIPELIRPSKSPLEGDFVPNGMTFESGNVDDLKEKIQQMWEAEFDYEAIAKDAIERYSSEAYIERLIEYYKGN